MPFKIIRQDISKMKVDAIVNAANTELKMGGGVCGAIFRAAGPEALQAACDKLAPIRTGEAVMTPGFGLPAKFVIHTAGPVYDSYSPQESERLLRSAYRASLHLALDNDCQSIAFPLISSGIYGYPKDQAFQVATSTIRDFLDDQDMEVYLAVFDQPAFVISQDFLGRVESYIDQHYVDGYEVKRRDLLDLEREAMVEADFLYDALSARAYREVLPSLEPLEDLIGNLDEPFSDMLLRLIDAKGMTDVQVYKRANMDRRLFSKIRSKKDYTPSKRTALALAVALELSLDETDAFLERAGYALSRAVKFDVIVEYFILNAVYDIFTINEVLFAYDQPLLGSL